MSDVPPSNLPPPPPSAPPPAPPPAQPPPPGYAPPPQGYAPPPQGYQQQMPQGMPMAVGAAGGFNFMQQFGGAAAWSIGLGVVGIIVPIVSNFYFPLLPIIGFINAIRAIQRGRMIGGIVGIVVNALAGLVALLASGLIGG